MRSMGRIVQTIGLLLGAAGLFALGCGYVGAALVGVAAGANGGGGGANQSARFTVSSTMDLNSATVAGGSSNIIGSPQIVQTAPDEWILTVELDDIPDGEQVHLTLEVESPTSSDGHVQVKSVAFYPVPPGQLPPIVQPPAELGPTFAWRIDGALGAVLDVTNPNPVPMSLSVDGGESDLVFSGSDVHYDGMTGVPWYPLANTTLAPQQTMTIDLPDEAVNAPALPPAALLLRYLSTVSGIVQKGASQLVLAGPITAEGVTWGRIKTLYR